MQRAPMLEYRVPVAGQASGRQPLWMLTPTGIGLTGDFWRAAAAIAGWRLAVNDPIRSSDRDRGREKNRLNEIQGVVGELIGIRVIEQLHPPPVMVRHDLLNLRGP